MKKLLTGLVLALMVIALPVGLVGCKKKTQENNTLIAKTTWEADLTNTEDPAVVVDINTDAVAVSFVDTYYPDLEKDSAEYTNTLNLIKERINQVAGGVQTEISSVGQKMILYVLDNTNAYIWVYDNSIQKEAPFAKMTYTAKSDTEYEIKYIAIETKAEATDAYSARGIEADAAIVNKFSDSRTEETEETTITATANFQANTFVVDLSKVVEGIISKFPKPEEVTQEQFDTLIQTFVNNSKTTITFTKK